MGMRVSGIAVALIGGLLLSTLPARVGFAAPSPTNAKLRNEIKPAIAEDSSTTEQPARSLARIEGPVAPLAPFRTPGIPGQAPAPVAPDAPDSTHDPLLAAMQTELARARDHLRLPEQPAPYFISLWVQEAAKVTLAVNNGALLYRDRGEDAHRLAAAQVRVGSYTFDNTQFSPRDQHTYGSLGDLLDEEDALPGLVPVKGARHLGDRHLVWYMMPLNQA